jgi:hypothetical protein
MDNYDDFRTKTITNEAFEIEIRCDCCFSDFTQKNSPQIINCGHTICISCIENIKKTDNKSCPYCRAKIKKNFTNFALLSLSESCKPKRELVVEKKENKQDKQDKENINMKLFGITKILYTNKNINDVNFNKISCYFLEKSIEYLLRKDKNFLKKEFENYKIDDNVFFEKANILSVLAKYPKHNKITKNLIKIYKAEFINSSNFDSLEISVLFENYDLYNDLQQ